MKFLVDENISCRVVDFLRSEGYDVMSVLEEFRSAKDSIILEKANTSDRVIITYDKDFGELAFKEGMRHKGIVLLRTKDESFMTQVAVLKKFLSKHPAKEIKDNFWVISEAGGRKAIVI